MLFSVCFQTADCISVFIHHQTVDDLNKSWFFWFGSVTIRANGLWRPLNYSSQTDDWLLIHPFFWKECLIIIPISTRPARSCEAKPSKFCTPASQACQIKRVCQWHFEDGFSKKNRGKKDELCKISLNIALQRSVSHKFHRFQSPSRHDRNALTLAQYSKGLLMPLFPFSPLSLWVVQSQLLWVF